MSIFSESERLYQKMMKRENYTHILGRKGEQLIDMYKVINSSDGPEILLYSLISEGYTASRLIQALEKTAAESITLRINSDGGDVFEAIALYNYLKDKAVKVVIDGICASAASIVAMAGEHIVMKSSAMMMIHNPVTIAAGESETLREAADVLDKITASIVEIYTARTGKTKDEIRALMAAETWMNSLEAVAYNFADEVADSSSEVILAPVESIAPENLSYEDGVKAERERLRGLDELYTPERAKLLDAAKYITGENAEQVAVRILKAESHMTPSMRVNNLSARNDGAEYEAFLAAIDRRKGR